MIVTGILIFLAETAALTLGTVRTLVTVLGDTRVTFLLGTLEMLIWTTATSAVMVKVAEIPFYGVCYALGFATGNVIGIVLEKRLALGNTVMRIISPEKGREIADALRLEGWMVTALTGEGLGGPVQMLFIVCKRKDMKQILKTSRAIDSDMFYTFDSAAGANKIHRPKHKADKKVLRKPLRWPGAVRHGLQAGCRSVLKSRKSASQGEHTPQAAGAASLPPHEESLPHPLWNSARRDVPYRERYM